MITDKILKSSGLSRSKWEWLLEQNKLGEEHFNKIKAERKESMFIVIAALLITLALLFPLVFVLVRVNQ